MILCQFDLGLNSSAPFKNLSFQKRRQPFTNAVLHGLISAGMVLLINRGDVSTWSDLYPHVLLSERPAGNPIIYAASSVALFHAVIQRFRMQLIQEFHFASRIVMIWASAFVRLRRGLKRRHGLRACALPGHCAIPCSGGSPQILSTLRSVWRKASTVLQNVCRSL
jgi:hypothetical protein